jgi:hypothetical protein
MKQKLIDFITGLGFIKTSNMVYTLESVQDERYSIKIFINPFDNKLCEVYQILPRRNSNDRIFFELSKEWNYEEAIPNLIKRFNKILKEELNEDKFSSDLKDKLDEILLYKHGFTYNSKEDYYETVKNDNLHMTVVKNPIDKSIFYLNFSKANKEYISLTYDINERDIRSFEDKLDRISKLTYMFDSWVDPVNSIELKEKYLDQIKESNNIILNKIVADILEKIDIKYWSYLFNIDIDLDDNYVCIDIYKNVGCWENKSKVFEEYLNKTISKYDFVFIDETRYVFYLEKYNEKYFNTFLINFQNALDKAFKNNTSLS